MALIADYDAAHRLGKAGAVGFGLARLGKARPDPAGCGWTWVQDGSGNALVLFTLETRMTPEELAKRHEQRDALLDRCAHMFDGDDLLDICYVLGYLSAIYLSQMDDQAFEDWIKALRGSRDRDLSRRPPMGHA